MPLTFGEQVRLTRRARELTQEELAQRVGTYQSVVSVIEHGRREPSPELERKIARALDLPQERKDK